MVLTQDYTYKLGDAGIVLNPDGISVPFVDVTGVSGLDNPPYRETFREHEGTDGGFLDAEFEKGREITVEGDIYITSDGAETFLDQLKDNYAPVTSPIPFYFKVPGVIERVVFVKPRGVRFDSTQTRRTGVIAAQFLMYAEDPHIYDSVLQTQDISLGGLATDGFGFTTESGLRLQGVSGSYASTPDNAAFPTGDIDLRTFVRLVNWNTGAEQTLLAKYLTTGNQRSFRLYVNTTGGLSLSWSNDGTAVLSASSTSNPSPDSGTGRLAVRATMDVDNGSGSRVITFYTGPSIVGPWTQLGSTVTQGGTTTIFDSTATCTVGAHDDGTAGLWKGVTFASEVRSGIGGTVVAFPDFSIHSAGTTGFTDGVSRVWTVNGSATVSVAPTVANANPFFETDASDWTPTGGTFVRSTAQFHQGAAAGLLTPDGVTATVQVITAAAVTAISRFTYKASGWIRCASSRNVNVGINWYTSGSSFISTTTTTFAVTANTWTYVEFVGTAPSNAGQYKWIATMTGTPPASDLLYIDEARLSTYNVVSSPMFAFPLSFGASTESGGAVVAVNSGNRGAPVVFTIYGPCVNPRIINDTLGLSLEFNTVVDATHYLVVDTYHRTVKLDGLENRRSALVNPDWFFLLRGNNQLRYRAASSDPSSYVTVSHRSAWR